MTTATILFVDDEPDLEALVLQKFRRQIRDGTVAFMFAHDGIEALASIEQHPHVDMEVHWRDVAVIFTYITGFTSLVETAAAEVLGALLNEYVGGMTDVVFAHEGTVAKIIGDAVQILFNAPGDQPDYA